MGACLSSRSTKRSHQTRECSKGSSAATVKIVRADGKVRQYKEPLQARLITSQNPSFFLCSSESLSLDSCPPQVAEEEELQAGQIYFLLPLALAHKPLRLPDLCDLAIKASSVVGNDGVEILSADSKFIPS
ncbi:uncharacterized protein LOC104420474 [Eucalyptus grandis]|uniref:Uncharacterized protein n=1 Tax=Eucalyptus globulus TaxID=34317 RepID=A0ABD3J714_EUCGL|nr:uncharacterized protein LOC104420474 [Eucalyptus grandis]